MAKVHYPSPTFEELQAYCLEKGFEHLAQQIFDYYEAGKVDGQWFDSNGKLIKNWKMKLCGVWFKESNRKKGNASSINIGKVDALMESSKGAQKYLDQMFPDE